MDSNGDILCSSNDMASTAYSVIGLNTFEIHLKYLACLCVILVTLVYFVFCLVLGRPCWEQKQQGISGYLRVLGTVHLVVRLLALWFPTSWMKWWILQAAWLPEEFEEVEACPLVRLIIPFDVWWGLESKHDATPRKSDQKLTQLYQKITWKQQKNNAETVSPGIHPNMRRS